MKGKVEYGEERREGKCFKLEDSKDCGEEKSQAMDVEKMQAKEKVKAIIESMPARANEESQSQVKAEYEEGVKAKDIERKRQPRATEDVEMKAEYEEGSRMEHIVEVSSVSEAKIFLHHNLYFATNYILLHLSIPRLLGLPMPQSPPPLAA